MGLLSVGTPLAWEDSLEFLQYVKKHGVLQFINKWKRLKTRANDSFLWGDEVEYITFYLPKDQKISRISLNGSQLMDNLTKRLELLQKQTNKSTPVKFLPEYGSFMIEATPGAPYGSYSSDLRLVEANMRLRRELVESILGEDEYVLTVVNHPRFGVGEFTHPPAPPRGPIAMSAFVPDLAINPHPRFGFLTQNIRTRRGSLVDIRMPLFIDEFTAEQKDASEIKVDAMAFGMGCSCLQVTFQARNIAESRHLYDQLVVLGPIMLALTASTPFHHGQIADTDVRWNAIAQSVDDRTPGERGVAPLKDGEQRIPKSRYDSVSSFISSEPPFKDKYNDTELVINEEALTQLLDGGVDELLARHIAHLFIRDPLVIFSEIIVIDDEESTNHFENIQSTNWQTCRFKPPPEKSDIGWRVEFRSMEISLTDFENAAFSVFIALINRAILFFQLNLYIPISKIDANMATAHINDAVRKEKFYFRSSIKKSRPEDSDEFDEYSMDEIINGSGSRPGLIPIVKEYLNVIQCDDETRNVVDGYLSLISRRASGELMTQAQWLRRFVQLHPDYKKDSIISEEVCRDILDAQRRITHGDLVVPQLLGQYSASSSHQNSSVAEVSAHTSSRQSARVKTVSEEDFSPDRINGVRLRGNSGVDFNVLDLFRGDDCVCHYLNNPPEAYGENQECSPGICGAPSASGCACHPGGSASD
uniref:Glutamate--cysteine ligase n=2 Tax=Hirondellea gigas TaxID=1518452 RepID=A0A6A7G5Y0_9CRUS